MTTIAEQADTRSPARPAEGRGHPLASPGWLTCLIVLIATTAVLNYYGVSYADISKFAGYTLLANTLPGLLIWRAVRRRSGYLAEDAAFGTVVGFVVELPVYMLMRAVGASVAVVGWPILTLVLFAAVPKLRRYWKGNGLRLPLGVSWTVALAFLFVLGGAAMSTFRSNALVDPFVSSMNVDFPFQFALVGEFKHQVPLNTPWVSGVALQYHWFVYAQGAAASWLTGIEPQTLILRLLPLPMVAAFLVTMTALVRRISGRWWAGNLAVLMLLIGGAVSPYAWSGAPMFVGVITDNLWVSPTQTFAALFFIAVIYVLAGILLAEGVERRRPARWVAFIALVGAVAGAKATFVPMLVCGLVLAIAVRLLVTRKVGAELVALSITLFWLGFAQIVLYGAGTQGTEVNPFQTVKWTQLGQAVMGLPTPYTSWFPVLTLTVVAILAVAFGCSGMVGLLRREWRMNPIVHVMFGFAAAGVSGLWIFAHPGLSQTYFARSASPYLAMLSSIGLAALLPARRRWPRVFWLPAASGTILAAAGLVVIQQTVGHDAPQRLVNVWSLRHALVPYCMLCLLLTALLALVLWRSHQVMLSRRYALAQAVVVVLAMAVTSGTIASLPTWKVIVAGDAGRHLRLASVPNAMPAGALTAGRWLRDHSNPGDTVATNSHCRLQVTGCDSRDFWLAAYSERRIVVEGWSYTEPAFESGDLWAGTLSRSKFWDQPLLRANDAVFYHPTAENVAAFTHAHHVHWLVAVATAQSATNLRDKTAKASLELALFAKPRFSSGDITVYEVVP